MTSNLGGHALSTLPDGEFTTAARREVVDAVRISARIPEPVWTEMISFRRLTRENMDGIVLQLWLLEQRLAATQDPRWIWTTRR